MRLAGPSASIDDLMIGGTEKREKSIVDPGFQTTE
jgi:hypothetical protein